MNQENIIKYIDNFYKMAGANVAELKDNIAKLQSKLTQFEDSIELDQYSYNNKKKLYGLVQYSGLCGIIYMSTGHGYTKISKAIDLIKNLIANIQKIESQDQEYESFYFANEIIIALTKILKNKDFLENRVKMRDDYSDQVIDSLMIGNNFDKKIKLESIPNLINFINYKDKQKYYEEFDEELTDFVFNPEDIDDEYKDQKPEIEDNLDIEKIQEEALLSHNKPTSPSRNQYSQNEIELALSEGIEQSNKDLLMGGNVENPGFSTINAGLFDSGKRNLESNINVINLKREDLITKKNSKQVIMDESNKLFIKMKNGPKKDEYFKGLSIIKEEISAIQNLIPLYDNLIKMMEKEIPLRIELSNLYIEYDSALSTTLTSSAKEKLKTDLKTYNNSMKKLKDLNRRIRENKLTEEEAATKVQKLESLLSLVKTSKETYQKVKRSKANNLEESVAERLREIEENYASNPADPNRELESIAVKTAKAEIDKLIIKLTNKKNEISKNYIERSNYLPKIKKAESELWLKTDGKNIKIVDVNDPFNMDKWKKSLEKIKNQCIIESSVMKQGNIVSMIDEFLQKNSKSEKEIKDFYVKVKQKFDSRVPNQYKNPQKKIEVVENINKVQQNVSSFINNEFAFEIPMADEAFLSFLESPETEIENIKKQFMAIVNEKADEFVAQQEKIKDLKEQYVITEDQEDLDNFNESKNNLETIKNELINMTKNQEKILIIINDLIENKSKNQRKIIDPKTNQEKYVTVEENVFDEISPSIMGAEIFKDLKSLQLSVLKYKQEIINNVSSISNHQMKRDAIARQLYKFKEETKLIYQRIQSLLNKIKSVDLDLYNDVSSRIQKSGYEDIVKNFLALPATIQDVRSFTPGKGMNKDIFDDYMEKFIAKVRNKILVHIAKYKESTALNKTTRIYYVLNKINSEMVSIASMLDAINKKKQNLFDMNKNSLEELLNSTISTSRKETKNILNENENLHAIITIRDAIEKIKSIAEEIPNEILEIQDFSERSVRISTITSNVIECMITLQSELGEYEE